jgi:hypothetical protein
VVGVLSGVESKKFIFLIRAVFCGGSGVSSRQGILFRFIGPERGVNGRDSDAGG